MSPRPKFAAVDWGTSSFRLWLMAEEGEVLAEKRTADGVLHLSSQPLAFERVLFAALTEVQAPEDLPVVICGMAGSRQGWCEAPYVDVPCDFRSVCAAAVRVPGASRDVRILPGLAQRPPARADVMRGEETQLLGIAQNLHGIYCLPGTHAKWVRAIDGRVSGFSTFMTGELFALLTQHSSLGLNMYDLTVNDDQAFSAGVCEAFASPELVSRSLFSIRAQTLLVSDRASVAPSRLSGLLIGLELAGVQGEWTGEVSLIAAGHLRKLYSRALELVEQRVTVIDADNAVRLGLIHAARCIHPGLM